MKKKNNNLVIIGIIGIIGVALLAVIFAMSDSFASGSKQLQGKDFVTTFSTTQNAVLIDVRTPAEFTSSHIASAVNIDFENQTFLSEIKKLDVSKTYFVYCRSGNRSGQAISLMKANGIKNIYELRGGISTYPELLQ